MLNRFLAPFLNLNGRVFTNIGINAVAQTPWPKFC